jgi:hypothetical protein
MLHTGDLAHLKSRNCLAVINTISQAIHTIPLPSRPLYAMHHTVSEVCRLPHRCLNCHWLVPVHPKSGSTHSVSSTTSSHDSNQAQCLQCGEALQPGITQSDSQIAVSQSLVFAACADKNIYVIYLVDETEPDLATTSHPVIPSYHKQDKFSKVFKKLNSLRILQGHTGGVTSLALSHSVRLLASGSNDRTIRLWLTRDWSCIVTLSGLSDSVCPSCCVLRLSFAYPDELNAGQVSWVFGHGRVSCQWWHGSPLPRLERHHL